MLIRGFKAMLMGQHSARLCDLPLILFGCDLAAVIAFLGPGADTAGLRDGLGLLLQPSGFFLCVRPVQPFQIPLVFLTVFFHRAVLRSVGCSQPNCADQERGQDIA